jgi:HlyD family secretion protein
MNKISAFLKKYKKTTIFVIILIMVGIWYYQSTRIVTATTYVVKPATIGTVETTVSGTGQVSSSQELAVYPQVSGTVVSVNVKDGDVVKQGQVLATLDSTNAYYSLENAKIALEKLETSNPISNTSDEDTVTNAQASLSQTYQSAFNTISSIYNDMGPVITNLNDIFYNEKTSPYFTDTNVAQNYGAMATQYKETAGVLLDQTTAEYTAFRSMYLATTLASTTSIDSSLNQELTIAQNLSNTIKDASVAVNYIVSQTTQSTRTSAMTTDQSNLTSWLSTSGSDNSSLANAESSIQSNEQSLTQAQANLSADQTTNNPLDLQSAQLSLQQAQTTYDNYTVTAPFDGTIGNVTLQPGDNAGASTAIGTLVTNQYISTIVLNEVDVAKVAVGQPVTITFNALPNITATGTVTEVDTVGTVSSGVVSYNVQISINTTDPQIKIGMSVNANIITAKAANVVVVPNAAVKTVGNRSYVMVPAGTVTPTVVTMTTGGTSGYGNFSGGSGRRYGAGMASTTNTGSTTGAYAYANASSTQSFGNAGSSTINRSGAGSSSSTANGGTASTVTTKFVQVGLSDNTNTQIISGINPGDLVVTQTITGTAAKTTTSSSGSILSSLTGGTRTGGGGGYGGGGAVRTGGTASAGGASAAR